jgi:hypothetical protein
MCWSISRQPSKISALDMRGLVAKQSSMLRTAWRQAAPTARASAAWRCATMPGVSNPSISHPLSSKSEDRMASNPQRRRGEIAGWMDMVERIVGLNAAHGPRKKGAQAP